MARPGVFLKRRISDQLLTALTILLSFLRFVIAPLQANGVISGTLFGDMFGPTLIPAIVMLSDDRAAEMSAKCQWRTSTPAAECPLLTQSGHAPTDELE